MFWRAIKLVRYSIKAALTPEQKQLILFAVYIQIFILLYAFVEVPFYSILFFSIYVYSCMIINTYYIDYLHAIKRSKLKRYNQYKGNNALGGKI